MTELKLMTALVSSSILWLSRLQYLLVLVLHFATTYVTAYWCRMIRSVDDRMAELTVGLRRVGVG